MTITIVGHGYVGLVTACVFADFGNTVYVIGHTKEKVDRLKKGDPIIYEPGLKELLQKNLDGKRIIFTMEYEEAVGASDIVFITVGTPPKETGEADLTAVIDVARKIGANLKKKFTVVSCKSTVPVGTNIKIETIINRHKSKSVDFAVASVPEFLREGTALSDTYGPDRVVIGSDSKKAIQLLLELHEPIVSKKIVTNLASAELIKYTSNCMLATKISFANLIALYCQELGADVEMVLESVGLDRRIGRNFLYPGIGYGGSCLPKDVKAFISIGRNHKIDAGFFQEVEKVNATIRNSFTDRIRKMSPGKKVAILGLSFKPNTDDIREAPSIYLIEDLLKSGFEIKAYDPVAADNVKKILDGRIKFSRDPYQAMDGADALIISTEWNEFKKIDLDKIKKLLKNPVIFDGRNIYNPVVMKKQGFKYYSIGRS